MVMWNSKRVTFDFSAMMTGFYFSQIIALGYMSYFLSSFGYGQTFIGLVTTLQALSSIVYRFISGYLMDKYSNPKILLSFYYSYFAITQMLLFVLYSSQAYVLTYASTALGLFFTITGTCDSWVLKCSKADSKIDYAQIRSVGSIAYALIGLFASWALPTLGNNAAFLIIGVAWAIFMYSVIVLPNPPKTIDNQEHKITLREGMKHLVKNKYFMMSMVCVFLYSLTNVSYTHYYSLYISELGGTTREIGLGLFVMAFTEFWVMRFYTPLAKKFGNERLLAFSFLCYVLRSVAMSFAQNTTQALIITALQTLTFALQMPGIMATVGNVVKYEYQASGVQFMGLVSTVGQLIFGTAIGAVYENFGRAVMLRVFAIPSLIAFVFFAIMSPLYKKKGYYTNN